MNGIFLIISEKFNFNEFELIGIRSQLRALKHMNLCLVTSSQNELEKFLDIFNEDIYGLKLERNKIIAEYFDAKHFKSIQTYNELLCSIEFYDRFKNYDFIVVSQPDVYLFDQDKLLDLPSLMNQYDYLGAPWIFYTFQTLSISKIKKYFLGHACFNKLQWFMLNFFNISLAKKLIPINWVYFSGNGGFSVRNTRAMIQYLTSLTKEDYSKINSIRQEADTSSDKAVYAEDVFWVLFPLILKKKFNVTPTSVSAKYAWEHGDLKHLMSYSSGSSPLAIHGWMKFKLKEYVLQHNKKNNII